ncbi:MAG: hypothetical protein K0R99_4389 [Microbacterium sp.]|nr:hypothetical protein [Microbacterium sp.]
MVRAVHDSPFRGDMTACDGKRSLPAPGLTFGECVPAPGATPATSEARAVRGPRCARPAPRRLRRGGRGRMGRPVRRVLSGGVSPVDGHLSRRHVAVPLQRWDSADRVCIPCLTLLRTRFTVRVVSPRPRWSLTPPFHPYRRERRRSAFCGTVSRITPGGCYPPSCPVEPGRSSVRFPATRPSSRPIRTWSLPAGCTLPRTAARRTGPVVLRCAHRSHLGRWPRSPLGRALCIVLSFLPCCSVR